MTKSNALKCQTRAKNHCHKAFIVNTGSDLGYAVRVLNLDEPTLEWTPFYTLASLNAWLGY